METIILYGPYAGVDLQKILIRKRGEAANNYGNFVPAEKRELKPGKKQWALQEHFEGKCPALKSKKRWHVSSEHAIDQSPA